MHIVVLHTVLLLYLFTMFSYFLIWGKTRYIKLSKERLNVVHLLYFVRFRYFLPTIFYLFIIFVILFCFAEYIIHGMRFFENFKEINNLL